MTCKVEFLDDPGRALRDARRFLESEPVLHNILLTLLCTRVAHPEPGRYWVAAEAGEVVGVVFQSPLHYPAVFTPMASGAVAAVVDAIADAGIALPGVSGEAATAARFAGQWTERLRSAAAPVQGQRLYEVRDVQPAAVVPGRFRQAVAADRDLVLAWMRAMQPEIGPPAGDPAPLVDRRLPAGQFWLWEDGEPRSIAAGTEPVAGVVRVQAVYTPPQQRRRGYAAACVGALSSRIRAGGCRCILYTDLGNPTSNSIYRRLGYRAVMEALSYRFD